MRIKRMGEVYSSGDVTVTVPGMQDVNPTGLEDGYSYAHEYQRGLRRQARGWRMGAMEFESNITMPLDIVAEFEKVSPKHDIARLRPFPIVVVFTNAENEIIKDVIWAKFQGNKRSITNDGELENQFDLFVLEINLNVGI